MNDIAEEYLAPPEQAPRKPGPYRPPKVPPTKHGASNYDLPDGCPEEYRQALDAFLEFLRANVVFNREKREYYRKTPSGAFSPVGETDLKRFLKTKGFSLSMPREFSSNKVTLFDDGITFIQDELTVSAAFNLSGHLAGTVTLQSGKRVLIPEGVSAKDIAPGDPQITLRFLGDLLGEEQQFYFLAWMKHALKDYRSGNPDAWGPHPVLCLVGPPECGKSLLQVLITEWIGGGYANPYDMLAGNDNGRFTLDLALASHWAIEDKPGFLNSKARAAFTQNLKHHAVGTVLEVHGKGRDKMQLPTFRRLSISCNEDADSLSILPILNQSTRDKLLVFKCCPARDLGHDRAAIIGRFRSEHAAFRHYLLHRWQVPEDIEDNGSRMRFRLYIHPDVESVMLDSNPENRFLELVNLCFFSGTGIDVMTEQRGSASEIHSRMTSGDHVATARNLVPSAQDCGRMLSNLCASMPNRFSRKNHSGSMAYTICPPNV